MAVVVLMMFLAASVSSVTLFEIDGQCASLQDEPALGVSLTVVACDPNDQKQSSWVFTPVGKHGDSTKFLTCIRGTNLCAGYKKVGETYLDNQVLLEKDVTSLDQQWIVKPGLPNNLFNLGVGLCDEVVDGLLEGRECKDVHAQRWSPIEM